MEDLDKYTHLADQVSAFLLMNNSDTYFSNNIEFYHVYVMQLNEKA